MLFSLACFSSSEERGIFEMAELLDQPAELALHAQGISASIIRQLIRKDYSIQFIV